MTKRRRTRKRKGTKSRNRYSRKRRRQKRGGLPPQMHVDDEGDMWRRTVALTINEIIRVLDRLTAPPPVHGPLGPLGPTGLAAVRVG